MYISNHQAFLGISPTELYLYVYQKAFKDPQ